MEQRTSNIACNQEEFNKAVPIYSNALASSGFSVAINFNAIDNKKKARKRKILWFNPPFSEHVTTNIGRSFLKLLDKHFPRGHRLRKICHCNNIKVSYSCMPNMAAVIFQHNKQLLKGKGKDKTVKSCNCRVKSECSQNGNCLERAIVYCASVNCPAIETKKYFGLCETDLKSRFNNHKHTFRNENKANATELSKYIWNCK